MGVMSFSQSRGYGLQTRLIKPLGARTSGRLEWSYDERETHMRTVVAHKGESFNIESYLQVSVCLEVQRGSGF